jgi:hypothetical protein
VILIKDLRDALNVDGDGGDRQQQQHDSRHRRPRLRSVRQRLPERIAARRERLPATIAQTGARNAQSARARLGKAATMARRRPPRAIEKQSD